MAREYLDKADEYGKGTDSRLHLSISVTRVNEFERDNKPEEARKILQGLLEEFSENPQLDPVVRDAFARFLQRRIVALRVEATLPNIDSEVAIRLKKEQDLLHEEFLSFIDASLEKYPAYFELQRQKATYYAVITGEVLKAEAVLEQLLDEERKRDKPKADRFADVAQFYAMQPGIDNNLEKAEERFLEAIQLDPLDLRINKIVIEFYYSNKKVFPGKALEFAEKQLKEHPDVVTLKVIKAAVLLEMEEYDRAIGLYREACKDKSDSDEAYVGYARAVIARDGYERGSKKAIEILTDGARNAPLSPSIFNDLGTLYYGQGKLEDALRQFERVKDIDQKDGQALLYIARIHLMQVAEQSTRAKLDNSIVRARDSAEAALSVAPKNGEANRLLGMIALHEGKPEEAVKYFKRAVVLTSDPLSFTQLIRLYFEYDWSGYAGAEDPARLAGLLDTYNPGRLKDWMEASFRQGEGNYSLQLTRGRILLMRDDSAAERRFKDAIRLTTPMNIEPYVYLDIYYLNRGNSTYADKQFARVAELSGKSVAQALAAVDIYRQNEWCDRAIELL
jgi:tetratricopeptide (TPR) repeat protein